MRRQEGERVVTVDRFNYWAAVYDREPKVVLHIAGDKIHSFFDIRGILKFGSGGVGKEGLTEQVIDMPIETFLGLAEPIPADDYKRHSVSSEADFAREVANGKDFGWTLPTLTIKKNEDDRWKVVGHDGRHRAKLLKSIGYEEMPVHLIFETPLMPEASGGLPKKLWCQNDCGREREKYEYTFPINDDNFGDAYFSIDREPNTWKEKDALSPANVKDEVNVKFRPLCPKANEEAWKNYHKDKEQDPYKRDASVPYSTFGEFLKKQDNLALGKEERGAV